MIKSSNKYLFYFFLTALFFQSFIYAEEISLSVYCANKDRKWHWLKDSQNQYISIKGEKKIIYHVHEEDVISVDYFNISGSDAENKMNDLKQKCISSFGPEFEFVQPAQTRMSDWILFSINLDKFTKGFFTINITSGKFLLIESFNETILNLNDNIKINDMKNNLKLML